MAINAGGAYPVVQIRTSLTTLWKNVTAQNVIKDLASFPAAFDVMTTKTIERIPKVGINRGTERYIPEGLIVARNV